ncbi:zinc-binding dehydrogenase [Actinomycetospora termitidis]|uniref:Zinc-binding dehydrogenase n=1 Tax=Actinomycetospora termitidis TaxID=3053470 RepID=A0ABT7MD15_9PSEU|nr:zinc-binding dehydrogenase [Actinomycetospora sp. Odt1-22]MDL5158538.1 zinc-binding dehydrogenase [Actinomycetospora sp. Odt1-22]
MQAIEIQTFGPPEGLVLVDRPDPAPATGQVLVTPEAIGVGGVDAVIRRGTLGGYGFTTGFVPGAEVAGTVGAVGDGVDPSWVGRRVWAFTGTGGAYAEQAVADVADVVPLPDGLGGVDAVALGSSGPVAHFALAQAHLAAAESVLIRGAAGSIGIAAVQLARAAGAGTIAVTTSSPERGRRLRELGATEVLDRSGDGATELDVLLDVAAGPDLASWFDRLAPNGRMVVVGVVAGMPPADFGAGLLANFRRSLTFGTFSADTIPRADRNAVTAAQFAAVVRGDLSAVVHDVLPLADAAVAHRRMDAGEVFGRIVLVP